MSLTTALDQIDHNIPLSLAIEMTTRFRDEKDNILKPEFVGKDILPLCETFGRSAFDNILSQTSCVAVRGYFGMDTEKKVKLIFVGVNDSNEDILPSLALSGSGPQITASTTPEPQEGENEDPGVVVEEGQRCPPICPTNSPLIQPLP